MRPRGSRPATPRIPRYEGRVRRAKDGQLRAPARSSRWQRRSVQPEHEASVAPVEQVGRRLRDRSGLRTVSGEAGLALGMGKVTAEHQDRPDVLQAPLRVLAGERAETHLTTKVFAWL